MNCFVAVVLAVFILPFPLASTAISPVFLWGAKTTDNLNVGLRTIDSAEFANDVMIPLLRQHMIIVYFEDHLKSRDFKESSCYKYLRQVEPNTYYMQVNNPLEHLGPSAAVNTLYANGELQFPLECTPGHWQGIRFNKIHGLERHKLLRQHDFLMSTMSRRLRKCPVVFLYMATPIDHEMHEESLNKFNLRFKRQVEEEAILDETLQQNPDEPDEPNLDGAEKSDEPKLGGIADETSNENKEESDQPNLEEVTQKELRLEETPNENVKKSNDTNLDEASQEEEKLDETSNENAEKNNEANLKGATRNEVNPEETSNENAEKGNEPNLEGEEGKLDEAMKTNLTKGEEESTNKTSNSSAVGIKRDTVQMDGQDMQIIRDKNFAMAYHTITYAPKIIANVEDENVTKTLEYMEITNLKTQNPSHEKFQVILTLNTSDTVELHLQKVGGYVMLNTIEFKNETFVHARYTERIKFPDTFSYYCRNLVFVNKDSKNDPPSFRVLSLSRMQFQFIPSPPKKKEEVKPDEDEHERFKRQEDEITDAVSNKNVEKSNEQNLDGSTQKEVKLEEPSNEIPEKSDQPNLEKATRNEVNPEETINENVEKSDEPKIDQNANETASKNQSNQTDEEIDDDFRFEESWDCDGFFSLGLVTTLSLSFLFVAFVTYAFGRLVDIRSVDRFDDPYNSAYFID